ncbi:LysM peptidoglycan-binding domain-containing protein [Acidithiobacillus sp. IBUN Pt1247-S3]|uniref:LysM peptidoglycan-binding domain-containing protein n=1 Tax=Acidithiobacillus sp. IBUN Pt1247-S3 TaxID=3166642 RepID=UPI0034E4F537
MRKRVAPLVIACALLGPLAPAVAFAQPATSTQELGSYVVQPGDTLWGIAAHFLKNPWEWQKIWRANPQIRNPNLIYPGDRIVLYRMPNGEPAAEVIPLQPKLQVTAIPSYHTGIIMPFLHSPAIIASKKDYEKLPYLAAALHERPAYTAGDKLFVSGIGKATVGTRYSIVRMGAVLHRLADPKPLGYSMVNLGTAELRRTGSEAEIRIVSARREIDLGDRLVPITSSPTPHYFPSAPKKAVAAQIVAKMNNAAELTVGQVVVLDQGANAELEPGNVLEIAESARMGKNAVTGKDFPLPPEKIGNLMIFRVFPEVSYAVITSAKRGIPLGANIYYPTSGPAKLRKEAQLTP